MMNLLNIIHLLYLLTFDIRRSIELCPFILCKLSKEHRLNEELAQIAYASSPYASICVHPDHLNQTYHRNNAVKYPDYVANDKATMLALITEEPLKFKYASAYLKSDIDIIQAAFRSLENNFIYCDAPFKDYYDVQLNCIPSTQFVLVD